MREAERSVESGMIAVSRAERTLRSWRLTNPDIEAIRAEAVRIHRNKGQWDDDVRNQWARVEVKAAIDGVVVEKNVTVGDVVDTTLDLFKIADLTRLDVLAHAYEEDLPLLEDLPPQERHWTIHLKSDTTDAKPLSGSFNQIGNIIDPNQHTALVMGWVNNMSGRLRVGQFVTAEVDLPSNSAEVAVPVTSLVDEDAITYIFVQPDPRELTFTRRKVLLVRRRDNLAYIEGRLNDERRAGYQPLEIGERVVTSGGLELASELANLQAEAVAKK